MGKIRDLPVDSKLRSRALKLASGEVAEAIVAACGHIKVEQQITDSSLSIVVRRAVGTLASSMAAVGAPPVGAPPPMLATKGEILPPNTSVIDVYGQTHFEPIAEKKNLITDS